MLHRLEKELAWMPGSHAHAADPVSKVSQQLAPYIYLLDFFSLILNAENYVLNSKFSWVGMLTLLSLWLSAALISDGDY